MSNASSSSSGGIGFAGVLTITFIVMKLMAYGPVAQWSWVWVLSPIWISASVAMVIIAIALVALLLVKRLRR